MHPSAIVWLCVPLFYRRDVKHRVCQGLVSQLEILWAVVQVVEAMEFGTYTECQ